MIAGRECCLMGFERNASRRLIGDLRAVHEIL